jgi:hypothetical protein
MDTFGSLLSGPGSLLGALLGTFGLLWGVLGALVRVFWVPLARLGCLWAPPGTSLCTQGRMGGSLSSTLNVLGVFVVTCMFFNVLPYVFSPWSVVEAAPQARPKTTPNARIVVEVCFACSFYIWALLGPFMMVLGFGLTMSLQRFSFKTRFPFRC